jgi:hypothetical protein
MSIHLNPLQPRETERGITFSADVNDHRVECLITYHALRDLNAAGCA